MLLDASEFVAFTDCAPLYALRAEKSTCNLSSSLISYGLAPREHIPYLGRTSENEEKVDGEEVEFGKSSDAIITSRLFM